MKTLNFKKTEDIFAGFTLNYEELIKVRGGGDGEPILLPNPPQPKI